MKPTKDELLIDCEMLSMAQIAIKYGVNKGKVIRWLKSYDIVMSLVSKLSSVEKSKRANLQTWSNSELKAAHSVKMRAVCNTDEYVNNHSKIMTDVNSSMEYRSKQSNILTEIQNRPESKLRISKQSKEMWQSLEHKIKMAKIQSAPEHKIKMAKIQSAPEYKARMAVVREGVSTTFTRPHVKVCELLTSLGVSYVTEKAVGPWNFDIFVEAANLLIEVQGDYWHNRKERILKDANKSTYIINNFPQYQLKYIWEHECLTEGSVLAKLKYWLGLDRVEQVDYELKQASVKPVLDAKQADTFLYNWHYQHHGRHGLDLGGYLGNELICLSRFTSPSRAEIATSLGYTQKQVLELARLVVHPKYQKKNLLSWFLARCERYIRQTRLEIEYLVSFADSTHNHTGAVYKASNWELNRVVEPNYWYVDTNGWVMHKRTLWSHAKKMCTGEVEYAQKNGFTKVWGKEKYKFTRKLGRVII